MSVQKLPHPISSPGYRMPREDSEPVHQGRQVSQIAVATFDPSGDTTERTIATHGLGVYLPDNAVVTKVWYDVVTTLTSATDAATVALGLETQDTDAFLTAIAISDATNPWDAGQHGGIPGYPAFGADAAHDTAAEVAALFAGTFVKTTAERQLVAVVATEALTAGKVNVYVEYTISD